MKKIKEQTGIEYFIEDANLYTLWIYSRPDFYPKEYFNISEITPLEGHESKRVFNFLATRLDLAKVQFEKFESYSDNDYSKMGIPLSEEALKGYDEVERETITTACSKFKDSKFGLEEIKILSPIVYSLFDSFYLYPELKKEELLKLKSHIELYIDCFLNNELFVFDRNYFVFEKQKQFFIEKIRKMGALESYGENFVVSEQIPKYKTSSSRDGFLFIHTLFALQKLGYIGVMRLWLQHDGSDGYTYHANIVVFDSFIDEVNSSYRKENPTNVFEKFDGKTGLLNFAGQEIELSKKGKETDAVLLLKTLLKANIGEWKHNDEILDDWGYNDEDLKELPKNKIYFAGQKVNTAVALKTKIEDFLECSTTKARVNPKYRKVDG